jgi:GH25 family lysozyme M1 (1,4-beta-N-acetylmuramidase)
MQSRNIANLKGVDLSHNNGNVNFAELKTAGVKVAMIKASEGSTICDASFKTDSTAARANGILQGFYHMLHIYKISTADAQAAYFLAAIKGLKSDCLLCVDVEGLGYHDNCSADVVTAQTLEFATKVKAATGIEVILYSNSAFINSHFTKDITKLRVWIADYRNVNCPGVNDFYSTWVGFQYSDSGKIGNMAHPFDTDEFTKDILIPVPKPIPKPEPIIPTSTLKLGSQGADVKTLQTKLTAKGFKCTVDGVFGSTTLKEVEAFQKANKLVVDGIVGSVTWTKLFS